MIDDEIGKNSEAEFRTECAPETYNTIKLEENQVKRKETK
jgi:hypothetical protein